jgi:hypothetical protein
MVVVQVILLSIPFKGKGGKRYINLVIGLVKGVEKEEEKEEGTNSRRK